MNGLLFSVFLPSFVLAAEPPIPEAERVRMLDGFAAEIVRLDAAIEAMPESVRLYSQRGDARLFRADFKAAVADFEKMIALDPTQDAPHWRLGIAYHFAGEFAKSSKQFVKYQEYESGDRENGIWKFMGDVKIDGIEAARRKMLEFTRFDREPFPALYEMFAGRKTTDEVFAEVKAKALSDNDTVMFFANYYTGINEDLLGRRERAIELLRQAVAVGWKGRRGGEPSYMWQVARLHFEQLSAPKPK